MQALATVGVACHLVSPAVRFVADGLDLLNGQRGLRDQLAVLVGPGPMRHIDLDPVSAVIELLACSLARLDRAVDDLHAFGYGDLGSIAFQRIAASRRNAAGCGEDTR